MYNFIKNDLFQVFIFQPFGVKSVIFNVVSGVVYTEIALLNVIFHKVNRHII